MVTRHGKDKAPHLAGVVSAGIVSQRCQKLLYQGQVISQCAICNAAVLAHPVAKLFGQGSHRYRFNRWWRHCAYGSQMSEKVSRSCCVVVATTLKAVRTRTSRKMPREAADQFITELFNGHCVFRNPMPEMGGRSEYQLSRSLLVAGQLQPLGEIIQVFADRALPQLAKFGFTINIKLGSSGKFVGKNITDSL